MESLVVPEAFMMSSQRCAECDCYVVLILSDDRSEMVVECDCGSALALA
ncbi:MAG: hypothetical protein H0U16_04640 [Actinobacteria bacterium]|nr:hypothetical protein [Actinomycetota bacterium]